MVGGFRRKVPLYFLYFDTVAGKAGRGVRGSAGISEGRSGCGRQYEAGRTLSAALVDGLIDNGYKCGLKPTV